MRLNKYNRRIDSIIKNDILVYRKSISLHNFVIRIEVIYLFDNLLVDEMSIIIRTKKFDIIYYFNLRPY